MQNKSVVVTGASGFLASHIILQLLSRGFDVRGSVRNAKKGDHIREVLERHGADTSRLSFVELDLMADAGWTDAMSGAGYLIHTASPFVTHIPKDENDVVRPALEGTRRALRAALASGIERIVLTSSEVAVTRPRDTSQSRVLTEADWSDVDAPSMTPYFKSKTLAEREAWSIMEKAGRRDDLSVVNPGFILGPLLEEDTGTSGAIIQKMMLGKFPGAADLHFSIVDVRDAAELHVLAMTDDRSFGHRVLAADATASFKDIAEALGADFPAYRAKLPTRRLPNFVVRLAALFDPDVRASVRSLGVRFEMDHGLARAILGRTMINWREAAKATAQSLIDMKLV